MSNKINIQAIEIKLEDWVGFECYEHLRQHIGKRTGIRLPVVKRDTDLKSDIFLSLFNQYVMDIGKITEVVEIITEMKGYNFGIGDIIISKNIIVVWCHINPLNEVTTEDI